MRKINLHIYPTDFRHESRILRETETIAGSGIFDSIVIAAIKAKDLPSCEEIDGKRSIWRVSLLSYGFVNGSLAKFLRYAEWMLKIFIRFSMKDVAVVNCHSLSCLFLGVLFKIFKGARLIYDAHELETETEGSILGRRIAKILERVMIPFADQVIVVSDSIGQWYRDTYKLKNITVVKNFPKYENSKFRVSNTLKEKLGLKEKDLLYIYQGSLGLHRGIDILLDVFSKAGDDKHIVIMGFGELKEKVREYERRFANIHFFPPVKTSEVLSYTSSADIGIHVIENTCLNHYYCLPNKIFEYICSGLPVIVSDFPDMGNVVRDNKCGWRVKVEAGAILDLVDGISREEALGVKRNAIACREEFTWSRQECKLLSVYKKVNSVYRK